MLNNEFPATVSVFRFDCPDTDKDAVLSAPVNVAEVALIAANVDNPATLSVLFNVVAPDTDKGPDTVAFEIVVLDSVEAPETDRVLDVNALTFNPEKVELPVTDRVPARFVLPRTVKLLFTISLLATVNAFAA